MSNGLELQSGDDYYSLTQGLKKRTNTYAIWLIIIGAVVILFLVMRKLFK